MSDAINHYYCGNYSIDKINNSKIFDVISKNRKLFDLGTQGPDFFFYHSIQPWKKSIGVEKYGTLLHNSSINQFFYESLIYLNSLKNDLITYNKLLSYLLGFLCHHSLDTFTHPYIYYFSGIYDNTLPETKIYSHLHKKLEILLDIAHVEFLKLKPACKFPIYSIYNISNNDAFIIADYYKYIFNKLYNKVLLPQNIIDSLQDAVLVLKFLPDCKNYKKYIFTFIEKIINKPYIITKALYSLETNNKDYLNLKHTKWLHPCHNKETHIESYPELFNLAVKDSCSKFERLFNILQKNFSFDDVHDIFFDVSFITGKPLNEKIPLKYYSCIFE